MEVALIRWPADEELRHELAELGHPRLLLVDADSGPPACDDVLEDWVRLPISRADRNARVRTLATRADGLSPSAPTLQGNGTMEFRGSSVHLSAISTELARALVERFGVVVSREALGSAAWPDSDPIDNNLDVAIGRLRRQLEPLGLRIRTVRSRGYVLTVSDRPAVSVR